MTKANTQTAPVLQASRRRDAARQLLSPGQIRESLGLAPQLWLRSSVLVGAQAALAAGIAMTLACLSPWPHLLGFVALGTLIALFGRFAPAGQRGPILFKAALCQTAAVLIMSLMAYAGLPPLVQLTALALLSGVYLLIATTGGYGPPGALIFVFAAGAAMGGHDLTGVDVLERTLATFAASVLSLGICAISEHLRPQATPERPFPADPLRPQAHRLIASGRVALGTGLAAWLAILAGAAHPAWAMLGAMAVLQGTHLHITMNRAVQRMLGTVAGAALAWAILSGAPPIWALILLLMLMQCLAELVIGANYALAQIFVTPMALLMTHLAGHGMAGPDMASERVLDTIIGAGIGIALALVFSTLDDRRHLAQHHEARLQRLPQPRR